MANNDQPLHVNASANRLELTVDGEVAFIEYRLSGKTLFLIHTEVPASMKGKGIGSALVEKAFKWAKDNNYKIVPICPFIRTYLERHQEWNDLVSGDAERFIN